MRLHFISKYCIPRFNQRDLGKFVRHALEEHCTDLGVVGELSNTHIARGSVYTWWIPNYSSIVTK